MSALRERIKALRKEAADLEPQAADQEREQAYLVALGEERRAAEQQLALGLQLGDGRETIVDPIAGGFKLGERTGRDIALEAERRLEDITRELSRVQDSDECDAIRVA
jgi:hypothetical protein